MAFKQIKAAYDNYFRKHDKSEEEEALWGVIHPLYHLISCIDSFDTGIRDLEAPYDLTNLITNLQNTLEAAKELRVIVHKRKQ